MVNSIKETQLLHIKEKQFRQRLVNDFLDLIVLHYLYKSPSPRRAKDVMSFCSNSFGLEIKDGYLYTLLFALETKKLIHGKSSQVGEYVARFYELSEKGRHVVETYTKIREEEILAFIKFLQTTLS